MPIMKYRSLEDAERSLWCMYPAADYYKRISAFYEFFGRLFSSAYPKGVFRYKNIDDADRQKFEWDVSRATTFSKVVKREGITH